MAEAEVTPMRFCHKVILMDSTITSVLMDVLAKTLSIPAMPMPKSLLEGNSERLQAPGSNERVSVVMGMGADFFFHGLRESRSLYQDKLIHPFRGQLPPSRPFCVPLHRMLLEASQMIHKFMHIGWHRSLTWIVPSWSQL